MDSLLVTSGADNGKQILTNPYTVLLSKLSVTRIYQFDNSSNHSHSLVTPLLCLLFWASFLQFKIEYQYISTCFVCI